MSCHLMVSLPCISRIASLPISAHSITSSCITPYHSSLRQSQIANPPNAWHAHTPWTPHREGSSGVPLPCRRQGINIKNGLTALAWPFEHLSIFSIPPTHRQGCCAHWSTHTQHKTPEESLSPNPRALGLTCLPCLPPPCSLH